MSKWMLLLGAFLILIVGTVLLRRAWTTPVKLSGENRPVASIMAGGRVNHTMYDTLLQRYVDERGLVNYRDWKRADEGTLDQYLAAAGRVDPNALRDAPEKLAFWINVYNALTIKGILTFYPTKSIKDHVSPIGFNIWKDFTITIHGREYSLDNIEHDVLRKMGEPRIHFAIVCASIGCPRLLNEAYTGDRLDAQLTTNAQHFFADPSKFRLDRTTETVFLSPLFDWFGSDFGGTDQARLGFVKRFLSNADDQAFLDRSGLSIKYLDYDWSLNERRG